MTWKVSKDEIALPERIRSAITIALETLESMYPDPD
jgi:hypothetical protein